MSERALFPLLQQNAIKSLFLATIMVTMSLSAGVVNTPPGSSELDENSSGLQITVITESIQTSIAGLFPTEWFSQDGVDELDSSNNEPMMTGGRSAPTISYSPNTFSLTQGTAMNTVTPSVTGTVTSWSISPSLPAGLSRLAQPEQSLNANYPIFTDSPR